MGSKGQLVGSEGLPEGFEGQQEGSEGQLGGDVWTDVCTYGQMYRISPHSTGLCPLSGPLPKKWGWGVGALGTIVDGILF